ncbi:hypothetical protein MTO96_034058 [Rhipicephalus appendiculatus]
MIITAPVVDGTCNEYFVEADDARRDFKRDVSQCYLMLFATAMIVGALFFIAALIFSRPSPHVESLAFVRRPSALTNGTAH